MSTSSVRRQAEGVHPELVSLGRPTVADRVWAVTRIALGFVFLWAFVDKLFGLGFSTPAERAWVNGGSPTAGFLGSVEGPFSAAYQAIAGQAWADWLFMAGLLGIGAALVAGFALRAAAVAGGLLLVLMWTAVLPITTNPFLDDHLVYALVLAGLAAAGADRVWGIGGWWRRLAVVRRFPVLR